MKEELVEAASAETTMVLFLCPICGQWDVTSAIRCHGKAYVCDDCTIAKPTKAKPKDKYPQISFKEYIEDMRKGN